MDGVAGLKVLDLGAGMPAALTTKLLAEAGAQVTRIAPEGGDPFESVYPAYGLWREGVVEAPRSEVDRLLAEADICIIGGEDYPGLARPYNAKALHGAHPRLVVIEITGYIEGVTPGPAVDLLVQARTGLVNEQLPEQPVRFAVALPTYGAALMAHIGLWTSLLERERTGKGRVVRASLQQGAALFWSQIWMQAAEPDATFDKLPPKGVAHLIFECADGDYMHFVLGVPGAVATVYRLLGIDEEVDPKERGIPSLARGPKSYFADAELIAPAIKKMRRQEVLEAFWEAGIPAEAVMAPGDCWDDEQVIANGTLRDFDSGRRGVGFPLVLQPVETPTSEPQAAHEGQGPLGPLRVVDLGNFIAGPFASKHFADYGADVIKVEPPNGLANLTGLRNVWVSNRGKRSICVDLKTPEGTEIVQKLCSRADVVHHNFRLGVAERIGFGPDDLRKLRPDVVVLQTRAFGSHGPKATRPGFDMVMQAMCGHEMRAGGEGNVPMWYRSAFLDYGTGTLGAIAALIGLYERARTGRSVEVEASLLGTGLYMMSELVRQANGVFEGAPLLNRQRTGFHPTEQIWQAADGWFAVVARGPEMAARFAGALGLDDLGPSAAWGDAEAARIAAAIASLTIAELTERLRQAEVWAEACTPDAWAAVVNDANAREQELVISVKDPTYGEVTSTFGPLVSLAGWRARDSELRSSPFCGQHTREILGEIGYDEAAIADLYERKVVA